MSGRHVFVVGCARSGTTLLRQILNMSERVCIAPETHFMPRFSTVGKWRRKWGNLADDSNLDRMIDFMYAGKDTAGSAYWSWLRRNVGQEAFRQAVRGTDRSDRALFELLMQLYVDKTMGQVSDDLIVGEKTPSHFNYIPTLLEWFPNAKVIQTFRDPRAILVSELKKMRKKGREGPKRLFRALPNWLLEPLELPFELVHTTRSWLSAAHWHAYCAERFPRNYTLVRFEDLVTEPEAQIRRVCDFIGIPFEQEMVSQVRVVGSSYQSQHRGATGFDRSALDRWKSNLPPAVGLWFTLLGGEQLKKFGYT